MEIHRVHGEDHFHHRSALPKERTRHDVRVLREELSRERQAFEEGRLSEKEFEEVRKRIEGRINHIFSHFGNE